MKKMLVLLSLALVLSGCHMNFGNGPRGSGVMKTEKRDVPVFNAVDVSGAFNVEIVCQKDRSLEIEGDDNLLALVETSVKNGTLYINNKSNYSSSKGIHVRITTPDVNGISSSGASKVTVTNVKNDAMNLDDSGAGQITLNGETKSLKAEMSGAGQLDAKELHAAKVSISSSGAGHAEVYATDQLDAEASGAASINYYGNPKVVNPSVSGAASVNKKGAV